MYKRINIINIKNGGSEFVIFFSFYSFSFFFFYQQGLFNTLLMYRWSAWPLLNSINKYLTSWSTLCFKIYWILLFLHVFSFIFNEYDIIKCFKKSVVGYIVGWTPEFFSFQLFSYIPISEEIQLLMYASSFNHFIFYFSKIFWNLG